ncbi:MAG: hypothetical protein RLY14_853 [Planctomycetota bacterium]|jgi:anti-anti-sigma factor
MSHSESQVACAIENSVLIVTLLTEKLREPQVVEVVKKEMLDALEAGAANSVIIDFRNVHYIGSMAFLAFLAVRRKLGGGRIVLCELSPEIMEVFLICRLIPASGGNSAPFEVAPGLSEARQICGLE